MHRNWADDLKVDYKDPASPVVGSELVHVHHVHRRRIGLHDRPGDGLEPHLKFCNDNRGYVNTKITKEALKADFRVLDYVTTPGAPVSTKASFEIRDGVPGLVARG